MNFLVYDSATGEIVRCLSGPSLTWAEAHVEDAGRAIFQTEQEVDPDSMRIDVSSNPPVLVAYIQPITAAEARAAYGAVIQSMLDEKARSRGYDSIASAISYRGDGNMQFAAEAEALFAWRSAVWTYSAAELDRVLEGLRIQPAIEAFLEEVEAACPFAWP